MNSDLLVDKKKRRAFNYNSIWALIQAYVLITTKVNFIMCNKYMGCKNNNLWIIKNINNVNMSKANFNTEKLPWKNFYFTKCSVELDIFSN